MPGPHDLLVRYTFGAPERAEAELRAVLPAHVVSAVDWQSLKQEPGSVVDEALTETETDLLFSARLRTGHPLLVYVLLEHQSSVDQGMALRMLRYVVRQLERWSQEHPEQEGLPVIIPLVLFHGQGGAWTAPRRVEELFHLPEEERELWGALVPRFEYLLDDLTAERAEVLLARPGPPLVRLVWLALRYGRSEELAERVPEWVALFAQVHAEATQHLDIILRYLMHVGDKTVRRATEQVLDSVMGAQRTEELMKTYGERLIGWGHRRGLREGLQQGLEQGRELGLQQGLQEGRLRGRAEAILEILDARGVQTTEEARQRILSCTIAKRLDRWMARAANATTLSDVSEDLTD